MLGGILGGIQVLKGRLTAARAAKLDNLDAAISTLPTAANYTSARAAKLDNLVLPPSIKTEVVTPGDAGMWYKYSPASLGSGSERYHFLPRSQTVGFASATMADALINTDRKFGLRFLESNDSSDVLITVGGAQINGAGWLLGLLQAAVSGGSSRLVFTIDGTVVGDSTYVALATGKVYVPIGIVRPIYTGSLNPIGITLADYPKRFNTSLKVEHRSTVSGIYTRLVYVLD